LTYREDRLAGWKGWRPCILYGRFAGLDAVINILVARDLYALIEMWLLAGAGGTEVGALLYYALA
jgi:hypothetical protein